MELVAIRTSGDEGVRGTPPDDKSRFTADTERTVRDLLARVLGAETEVTLESVDALPVSPGAPAPTCVSALAVPLTRAA